MVLDMDAPLQSVAIVLIPSLLMLYTLYGAFWRLYLSPVAHIPGPTWARLTFWNEFYYDVLLGGQYTWKIKEYHSRYGPVIRINPFEVHIDDPDFLDELYAFGSKGKTDKWGWSMRMFAQNNIATFDTLAHDLHRLRRAPWNPYFSKASMYRIQPLLIQDKVNNLCDRLAERRITSKPVNVTHAYACLTTDVISEYVFPDGYELFKREGEDFDGEHYNAWMAMTRLSHLLKQFPLLFPILDSTPQWLTKIMSPDFYVVLQMHNYLTEQINLLKGPNDRKESEDRKLRTSLLKHLLESDLLPESERQPERVKSESVSAIGAGTVTTVHALKVATYHILANPSIHARLMRELNEKFPNLSSPPDLRELESMTYLVAIMYETFRIFYGVTHRLSRVLPDRALTYTPSAVALASNAHCQILMGEDPITIPPGTPVGMDSVHVHDHPSIFPSPHEFNPDRWLPLDTNGQRLQKYLMTFGKGTRQCVGMELGKAEFLTVVANVWRRFGDGRVEEGAGGGGGVGRQEGGGDGGGGGGGSREKGMRLHDTQRERDVDVAYDYFNPESRKDGNGVLVVF